SVAICRQSARMAGELQAYWRIELFGGLRLVHPDRTVQRFRSQKTAALLAYLALHLSRRHPREELVDQFWPGEDFEAARHNLRQSLTSLRRQLEPPGIEAGAVLLAERASVALNPSAATTD